jgi:hypothetical protein
MSLAIFCPKRLEIVGPIEENFDRNIRPVWTI